ncbi:hypothetical protein R3P38DRAFT_3183388 [Favolaschia claudopus]|uniref:CxC2-like cysteine cluster KDZ transposase-associated domain-containing protein n=1 Tax=Favolaschia claudopus TaxID=2862362 RepID=A0AAW0C997_9AGAR
MSWNVNLAGGASKGKKRKIQHARLDETTRVHNSADPNLVIHHRTSAAASTSSTSYIPRHDVQMASQEKIPSPCPPTEEAEEPSRRPTQTFVVLEQLRNKQSFLQDHILSHEASVLFGQPCACGVKDQLCEVKCNDCLQYRPSCKSCFIRQHRTNPLHWAEVWDEEKGFLVRNDIAMILNQSITLGHYGDECAVGPEKGTLFTIVHTNGIHATRVMFCQHDAGVDKVAILLKAQLFPCTFNDPKSAVSFECLRTFLMISMEGALAAYDYVGSLARLTDNAFTETVPDLYENFIRIVRVWAVLALVKRMGQEHGIDAMFPHRPEGNVVLYCPSCPEPGFNMDPKIGALPAHLRHLNQQRDTLDGNFHCNKAKKNTDPTDVSLHCGKAYFPTNEVLKSHLDKRSEPEPKSTCNYLKAVKNQDKKKFKNMEITGIVNTQCSHVFVKASVDLQFGERYANVDLALGHALRQKIASGYKGSAQFQVEFDSVDRVLSYDAMCQYSVHIVDRFKANPELQDLAPVIARMRFSIPALHVTGHQDGCMYAYSTAYMLATAHFHGETAEFYWPRLNQLGPIVRQMNGGHRHDTVINAHSDWNWKKMAKSITLLVRELQTGEQLRDEHRKVFLGLSFTHAARVEAEEWLTVDRTPDKRKMSDVRSVYRMSASKVPSQNSIYKKLLSDEALVQNAGAQIDSRKDTVAYILNEGIRIQAIQREISAAVQSNAIHALESKQKFIADTRAKVIKRIAKFRKAQKLAMPDVLEHLSNRPACDVEAELLGLPSDFEDQADRLKLQLIPFVDLEASLREGQVFDAMKRVKSTASTLSTMNISSNKIGGSTRKNTISQEEIKNTRTVLLKWINEYNCGRKAMIALGYATGGEDFPELHEEHTYKKAPGLRKLGDSRRAEGLVWTLNGVRSGARFPASLELPATARPEANAGGTGMVRRKAAPAKPRKVNALAQDSEEKTPKKRSTGWIWKGKLGKMTSEELDEWSREGDRVHWFRAEAEWLRQAEVVEAKLAEIRTTIRSFERYSRAWKNMAEQQLKNDPTKIGHVAYAKQKAWMFQRRAELGREALHCMPRYSTLAEDDADLVAFVTAQRSVYSEELNQVLDSARSERKNGDGIDGQDIEMAGSESEVDSDSD